MRGISLYIVLAVFMMLGRDAVAQERPRSLANQHVTKLHIGVSPFEISRGLSYQYYPKHNQGIQINMDYLSPMETYHWSDVEYQQSGYGFRLNPEFRIYVNRSRIDRPVSLLFGIGPVLKTFQLNEYKWNTVHMEGTPAYQQATNTNFRNLSYGAMARVGCEAYIGKPKKFVLEGSFGMGHMVNRIRTTGDDPLIQRDAFDVGVDNRDASRNFYVDLKLGIGYRFGKSYENK